MVPLPCMPPACSPVAVNGVAASGAARGVSVASAGGRPTTYLAAPYSSDLARMLPWPRGLSHRGRRDAPSYHERLRRSLLADLASPLPGRSTFFASPATWAHAPRPARRFRCGSLLKRCRSPTATFAPPVVVRGLPGFVSLPVPCRHVYRLSYAAIRIVADIELGPLARHKAKRPSMIFGGMG